MWLLIVLENKRKSFGPQVEFRGCGFRDVSGARVFRRHLAPSTGLLNLIRSLCRGGCRVRCFGFRV